MKIAGVSLTYNDSYKLSEWHDHYQTYKDQLDLYVIVDNNSEEEYKERLKKTFSEAIIIERETNGGCTGAYNDGIRYVLQNTDADAILILANDMKLTKNCIPAMSDFLFNNPSLGMVSAAILFRDSYSIETFGFSLKNMVSHSIETGKDIHQLEEKSRYVDLLPGGFTLAKREFYEKAGLQDENLFMYCDETDTTYKARKFGFKLAVISNEYAWHQHVNQPSSGRRSSASRYLICRNRIYLAKKYEKLHVILSVIYKGLFYSPLVFIYRFFKYRKKDELKDAWYCFMGGFHGIIGYMKFNKYMVF